MHRRPATARSHPPQPGRQIRRAGRFGASARGCACSCWACPQARLPRPRMRLTKRRKRSPAPEAVKANAAADDPTRHFAQIDQHRIFTRTLRDLLINSRLSVETRLAEAAKPRPDLSPATASSRRRCRQATSLDALRKQRGPGDRCPRPHVCAAAPASDGLPAAIRHSVAAVYTGVVPIVYKAQRMLLDSLIQSTFWSVITITPLLMWIARSVQRRHRSRCSPTCCRS